MAQQNEYKNLLPFGYIEWHPLYHVFFSQFTATTAFDGEFGCGFKVSTSREKKRDKIGRILRVFEGKVVF